jgi:DNA-binding phage protein
MDSLDRPISAETLLEADRRLAHLEDVCREEDETVPAWVIAARQAVQAARKEEMYDER